MHDKQLITLQPEKLCDERDGRNYYRFEQLTKAVDLTKSAEFPMRKRGDG